MLREEVLQEWQELKSKFSRYSLSPTDKANWTYLAHNKSTSFIPNTIIGDEALNNWEREIEEVKAKINEMDLETENDLLLDYWFVSSKLASVALSWIEQRKLLKFYREELKGKTEHWRRILSSLKEEVNKPRPTALLPAHRGGGEDTSQWKVHFNSLRQKINALVLPVGPDDETGPTIEEVD